MPRGYSCPSVPMAAGVNPPVRCRGGQPPSTCRIAASYCARLFSLRTRSSALSRSDCHSAHRGTARRHGVRTPRIVGSADSSSLAVLPAELPTQQFARHHRQAERCRLVHLVRHAGRKARRRDEDAMRVIQRLGIRHRTAQRDARMVAERASDTRRRYSRRRSAASPSPAPARPAAAPRDEPTSPS